MPSGGDVIELVHEQTYLGQQMNNVYYFEAVDGTASLISLAAWFETNLVPDVKAIQNDLVTHTNLRLRNLFNLAETYEEPLTGTGVNPASTSELPAFFAFTCRMDHDNAQVRPGFKRWSGMHEANVTDSLLDASAITALTAIAVHLVNPLSPALATWAHVVVGRVCETPNPTPGDVPACLKYRLPENQIELVVGYPTSVEVYSQPTTQNSRKWYT